MENKYSGKAADVLAHLHHAHTQQDNLPSSAQHCIECDAGPEDIVSNDLPRHHPDFTCTCLICGCQWMPNAGN